MVLYMFIYTITCVLYYYVIIMYSGEDIEGDVISNPTTIEVMTVKFSYYDDRDTYHLCYLLYTGGPK